MVPDPCPSPEAAVCRSLPPDVCLALFDSMEEGVCLFEPLFDDQGNLCDYRITQVNPAYERLVGLSAEEVCGRSGRELWQDGVEPLLAAYAPAVRGDPPQPREIYFPRLDRHFRLSVTRIHSGLFASIFSDISQSRRLQNDLARSEAWLQEILEALPFGVVRFAGDRLHCNPAVEAITGYSPGEIDRVDHWLEKLYGDRATEIGRLWAEDRAAGLNCSRTLEIRRKDGARRILRMQGIRREDLELLLLHDVTKEQEKQAAEARYRTQENHALIGRVAGKMAHDFNNVLGIVVGLVDLLLQSDPPDSMREELELIVDAGLRGRDMTRNLLVYARSGELRRDALCLCDLLRSVVERMDALLSRVELHWSLPDPCPRTQVDADLLENAIYNLLLNAVHAVSRCRQPRVEVELRQAGNEMVIEIRDNGCGIPPEHAEDVFEPAFTLKGSRDRCAAYSKEIRGSGFGLANVKRCAELHGGHVEHEARPQGGTIFRLRLPFISAGQVETVTAGTTLNTGPYRILVVDDEPALVRLMKKQLENRGHRVEVALNGVSALKLLDTKSYDLVSLDYRLPDINGTLIYRNLREKHPRLPVLFVSGNFEFRDEMARLCSSDPRARHLGKPLRTREYLKAIDELLAVN